MEREGNPISDRIPFVIYSISCAHLKANFTTITAKISLIIAAATRVPETIADRAGSMPFNVVTAIPVNTRETHECGNSVNPRYRVTVGSAFVSFPPRNAPPIFPPARDKM